MQQHAKVCRTGRVPAVFYFGNIDHLLANLEPYGTLAALISGIAFHAHGSLKHRLARPSGWLPALHSTPGPTKKSPWTTPSKSASRSPPPAPRKKCHRAASAPKIRSPG